MKYDVIIVGAGPAGIFSALELTEKTNLNVLVVDRGADIDKRKCPSKPWLRMSSIANHALFSQDGAVQAPTVTAN